MCQNFFRMKQGTIGLVFISFLLLNCTGRDEPLKADDQYIDQEEILIEDALLITDSDDDQGIADAMILELFKKQYSG